jgi:transposase-like protein
MAQQQLERPAPELKPHLCSPPPLWMSMREVAERYGETINTLRRWRRERKGPIGIRNAGGSIRYPASEIERYDRLLADRLRQQQEDMQPGPGPRTGEVQRHRRRAAAS